MDEVLIRKNYFLEHHAWFSERPFQLYMVLGSFSNAPKQDEDHLLRSEPLTKLAKLDKYPHTKQDFKNLLKSVSELMQNRKILLQQIGQDRSHFSIRLLQENFEIFKNNLNRKKKIQLVNTANVPGHCAPSFEIFKEFDC